jgi:alpha-D-ribose 1-methylphosphonate 5-triphosphate diphosphatase
MKKIIENGTVIGPESEYHNHRVLIEDEQIVSVQPMGAELPASFLSDEVEIIDAAGGLVVPGFIDIHSDYIEHMAAPRPSSLIDFRVALHETERELMMHGITTMYHSLSFNDATAFKKKKIRSPEYTREFARLISQTQKGGHLIHHRFHARFEISSVHRVQEIEQYIEEGKVHLLSFTDHTPGQGQYRDVEVYRGTMKGYRDVSEQELDRIVESSLNKDKLTVESMTALVEKAREHQVAVASHDDDTIEKLKMNQAMGLNISEFPIHIETALAAKSMGFHTVAGAPNILLGGSHTGNLSAAEAVDAGAIDILCSDYYPASLLHAVFILHKHWSVSLVDAFRLVTLNPAKAVKADEQRGSIEPGKAADILIIHQLQDGYPAVDRVLISGQLCMQTQYRGRKHD